MCKKARVKYQDFEDKVKQLELKITGKVSSAYDLDQSILYNNFINDETQDQDEVYDYVRKAHLKLIVERKQFVTESKEKVRGEERKSKGMSEIWPVGASRLQSSRASNQDDGYSQMKYALTEEVEAIHNSDQLAYIPNNTIDPEIKSKSEMDQTDSNEKIEQLFGR